MNVVRKHNLQGRVKIGVVTGDDLMNRLDDLIAEGITLNNMETGESLAAFRQRVQSANVYFGAAPISGTLSIVARTSS